MQNIQCIHRKKYTHNNKTLQNLKHNIIYKRWPHHILNCFCGIIYIYIYIYRPTEQQLCDDSAIQQYTENSKSSLNKLHCRRRRRLSVKQKYCAGIWLCNRSASPTPPPPPAAAAGAIMCRSVLSAPLSPVYTPARARLTASYSSRFGDHAKAGLRNKARSSAKMNIAIRFHDRQSCWFRCAGWRAWPRQTSAPSRWPRALNAVLWLQRSGLIRRASSMSFGGACSQMRATVLQWLLSRLQRFILYHQRHVSPTFTLLRATV